jgi:hypothetical protein
MATVTLVTEALERIKADTASGTGQALAAAGAERAWYRQGGAYVETVGGSGGAEGAIDAADIPPQVLAALETES